MADYTYEEAAARLVDTKGGVTVSWLRQNIKRLPHLQFGHKVFFTDAHLAEIRAMHEWRPEQEAS